MNLRRRAAWLIVVQCAVVCAVAGKYWYERATLPRVWVRAEQVDPESLIRGRYLMLNPLVDACGLPRNEATLSKTEHWDFSVRPARHIPAKAWEWQVTTQAVNGKLAVKDAADSRYKSNVFRVSLPKDKPCDLIVLESDLELYVPENAKIDLPAQGKGDVWVEVTVPNVGPPRPIQLATNVDGKWRIIVR